MARSNEKYEIRREIRRNDTPYPESEYKRAKWQVAGVPCEFDAIQKKLEENYGKEAAKKLYAQLTSTYTQEIQKFAVEKFFFNENSDFMIKMPEDFTINLINLGTNENPQLAYQVTLKGLTIADAAGQTYNVSPKSISYDCVVDKQSLKDRKPYVKYVPNTMKPDHLLINKKDVVLFENGETRSIYYPSWDAATIDNYLREKIKDAKRQDFKKKYIDALRLEVKYMTGQQSIELANRLLKEPMFQAEKPTGFHFFSPRPTTTDMATVQGILAKDLDEKKELIFKPDQLSSIRDRSARAAYDKEIGIVKVKQSTSFNPIRYLLNKF